MDHYCLIDASGFMHRAKAMAPAKVRKSDGMDVGVTAMFMAMLAKAARRACAGRVPPTHWGVAFDPPRADSWRRKICPAYKAHRPETEEAFKIQVPLMKECARAAGFALLEAPEHEADDLLAAYAHDASELGARVTIVTADKDLMQMVRPNILVWDSQRDVWYTPKKVLDKFEVEPERLGDYLALAGDVADGITGARGIGPKTAVKILGSGTLSEVLQDPSRVENPKWRALIEGNIAPLREARLLVSLDIGGCPRPLALDSLRTVYPQGASERLYEWSNTVLLAGGVRPAVVAQAPVVTVASKEEAAAPVTRAPVVSAQAPARAPLGPLSPVAPSGEPPVFVPEGRLF